MKIEPTIRKTFFGFVLIALVFALIVPVGVVLANEDDDDDSPVLFNVINESQFEFTLYIWGPDKYEISVDPEAEAVIRVATEAWNQLLLSVVIK